MTYKGRILAVGIVILFNGIRYVYYHQYLQYPFQASFFILTAIFLLVAWLAGRQYDVAKYYAEKDPLTNAYNRRTVHTVFKKRASTCKVKGKKMGVVLIDLDKFKTVNDTYGHQKGDELLRYVANLIKMNAKDDDLIVRWGGDEFVHIIPNIKECFQTEYVKKFKKQLANMSIESIPKIDASIGIAIYPDDGECFEELIHQADAKMYDMKNE
ncbi:GGDEF domain-containing protein [Sporosarcina sp. PTS2304]|uniref:GGDEF domain-containing protein n=1 Tax=Sporosarcina sp. PTS2304 TaxID=2283194 RepID=UPI000E0D2C7B|nr:GGDEF domain-containing protein [Sporosarcina sp. PTS2304]AXI00189.1 GGDEF domain-containing protein [Sporosarcina sp. PTS2304]